MWFAGRPWCHGCWLPLPLENELDEIERETRDLTIEGDPGESYRECHNRVHDWVYRLELLFRDTSPKAVNSWRNNIDGW